MGWHRGFAPYVPVAERRRKATQEVAKLAKQGYITQPVVVAGRTIAKTFWGKAWCDNLEAYSDYANRLPRGRTYVHNGSIVDLNIAKGEITALVSGSSTYKVKIIIAPVPTTKWHHIVTECASKIDSVIELLQGKFSKAIMEIMTHPTTGLFPSPKEIKLSCSCPDWADMCKHVAAVLYGVGARLDTQPENLFLLRQVDHVELMSKAAATTLITTTTDVTDQVLAGNDLSALFGIDLEHIPQHNVNTVDKTQDTSVIITKRETSSKTSATHNKKIKATKPRGIVTQELTQKLVKKAASKTTVKKITAPKALPKK